MPERVVVIPAHGHGTRLREVTGGRPKTLLDVGGEPILARLLRAVGASGDIRTVVYTRHGDDEIPAFLASQDAEFELRCREPRGYLRDVVDISYELGDEFSVLDCDLVTPCAELTRFLTEAPCPDGTATVQEIMSVGVSATPPSEDPRSIRIITHEGVMALADGAASHVPRAIGAYHWRPAAIADARRFVMDSNPGRFHDYVRHLAATRARVAIVAFHSALNVNTRAELHLAESHVRSWRERGLD